MERGDITDYAETKLACVFEHVLASPPSGVLNTTKERWHLSRHDWDSALKLWTLNPHPIKELSHRVHHVGMGVEVVTFLGADAGAAIDKWLARKDLNVPVEAYDSPEDYASDLRFRRGIIAVYTPEQYAYALGARAVCVTTESPWSY